MGNIHTKKPIKTNNSTFSPKIKNTNKPKTRARIPRFEQTQSHKSQTNPDTHSWATDSLLVACHGHHQQCSHFPYPNTIFHWNLRQIKPINLEKSSNPHEKNKPINLKQTTTQMEKQTQVREIVTNTNRFVTYIPRPSDGAPCVVTLIPDDGIRPLVTGVVEQRRMLRESWRNQFGTMRLRLSWRSSRFGHRGLADL